MGMPDIYEEIAEIAGEEAAAKLAEYFSGQRVYFPVYTRPRHERNKAIIRAHANGRGLPVSVLAQRYGLSARRVQQILAEAKKKEVCDG